MAEEHADANGRVRLELELVFRAQGQGVGGGRDTGVGRCWRNLISRTRVDGAGYHALLVEVPEAELVRVWAQENAGLVAEVSIFLIRPQSVSQPSVLEVQEDINVPNKPLPAGEPIGAAFDAVPIAGHPILAGRLSVDDIFGLEPLAVGGRFHGTAMASAIIHGDLNLAPEPALDRPIYFVNVMYAPGGMGQIERFPNKLPGDLFHEAIVRTKARAYCDRPRRAHCQCVAW